MKDAAASKGTRRGRRRVAEHMSTTEPRMLHSDWPGRSPERDALVAEIESRQRDVERLQAELAAWEATCDGAEKRMPVFSSVSGNEVDALYTPAHAAAVHEPAGYLDRLGLPGGFPFTRGPYATMYRTRLWTMRQFAGFATAEETNQRYRYLLDAGQTGLSVAFDFPTLMGYDGDHPRALGEVGVCGVAVSSLADMETLFREIPPRPGVRLHDDQRAGDRPVLLLRGGGGEAGASRRNGFGGTVQNDILKEYQAQHAWVFPPDSALRLILDMFDWCGANAPSLQPRVDLGLPHPGGPAPPPARSWPSPWPTASSTCGAGSSEAWTWTSSRPACRSSSTCTTTSSRRSPSSGPLGGSGPSA